MENILPGGLVHDLPEDLSNALRETKECLSLWKDLTPLGRNEFICWVQDAKQEKTRARRIKRTIEELGAGKSGHVVGRGVFIAPIKNRVSGSKPC